MGPSANPTPLTPNPASLHLQLYTVNSEPRILSRGDLTVSGFWSLTYNLVFWEGACYFLLKCSQGIKSEPQTLTHLKPSDRTPNRKIETLNCKSQTRTPHRRTLMGPFYVDGQTSPPNLRQQGLEKGLGKPCAASPWPEMIVTTNHESQFLD